MEEDFASRLGKRISTMTDEELAAHVEHLRLLTNDNRRTRLIYEPRNGAPHEGFVYIQSHPDLPGLLKIGITSVSDFDRDTGVDTGEFFELPQLRKIIPVFQNLKEAERKVVRSIVAFRESGNREFFRLSLRQAIALVECALEGADSD